MSDVSDAPPPYARPTTSGCEAREPARLRLEGVEEADGSDGEPGRRRHDGEPDRPAIGPQVGRERGRERRLDRRRRRRPVQVGAERSARHPDRGVDVGDPGGIRERAGEGGDVAELGAVRRGPGDERGRERHEDIGGERVPVAELLVELVQPVGRGVARGELSVEVVGLRHVEGDEEKRDRHEEDDDDEGLRPPLAEPPGPVEVPALARDPRPTFRRRRRELRTGLRPEDPGSDEREQRRDEGERDQDRDQDREREDRPPLAQERDPREREGERGEDRGPAARRDRLARPGGRGDERLLGSAARDQLLAVPGDEEDRIVGSHPQDERGHELDRRDIDVGDESTDDDDPGGREPEGEAEGAERDQRREGGPEVRDRDQDEDEQRQREDDPEAGTQVGRLVLVERRAPGLVEREGARRPVRRERGRDEPVQLDDVRIDRGRARGGREPVGLGVRDDDQGRRPVGGEELLPDRGRDRERKLGHGERLGDVLPPVIGVLGDVARNDEGVFVRPDVEDPRRGEPRRFGQHDRGRRLEARGPGVVLDPEGAEDDLSDEVRVRVREGGGGRRVEERREVGPFRVAGGAVGARLDHRRVGRAVGRPVEARTRRPAVEGVQDGVRRGVRVGPAGLLERDVVLVGRRLARVGRDVGAPLGDELRGGPPQVLARRVDLVERRVGGVRG